MKLIDADELLTKQYCIDDSATLSTRMVVNIEDIQEASEVPMKIIKNIKNNLKWYRGKDCYINIENGEYVTMDKAVIDCVLEIIDRSVKEYTWDNTTS